MRIAIFGTGGAGGYFGAQLARAGEDVIFIARGEHLRAIRTQGLRVETPAGEIVIRPAHAGVVDAVILGVKTWQVTEAARAMQPMIGPETFVVPLQNGVEAPGATGGSVGRRARFGRLVRDDEPDCRARPYSQHRGCAFRQIRGAGRPAERTGRAASRGLRAGRREGRSPSGHPRVLMGEVPVRRLFRGSGCDNAGAYRGDPDPPETRQMLEQCLREVVAVAPARRVALADGSVEKAMAFLDSLPPGGTTSLQRDIADGKPSEIDAWNRAVVRRAGKPASIRRFMSLSVTACCRWSCGRAAKSIFPRDGSHDET